MLQEKLINQGLIVLKENTQKILKNIKCIFNKIKIPNALS